MKTLLTALGLAVALFGVGGCESGQPTAADDRAAPPPAAEPAPQVAAAADPYSTPGREPFTYVEQKKEKSFTDYLLPWKWFESDEQTDASVTEFDGFEEAEVEVESENQGGPFDFLAFWKWGQSDEKRKPITFDDALDDMSPELVTRSETKPETRIRRAKVLDYNGRAIWDDLNDIMFFDRPSRMSLYPSP